MNAGELQTTHKVLVAPLDWGLGHATRCVPIIKTLLRKNCSVLLAAEGATAALLQAEFPQLPLLPLKGYRVQYPRRRWQMPLHMAAQVPQILAAINNEHRWLAGVVKTHQIDAVISDNRYGLYHPKVPTVFITHQLRIRTGWGAVADSGLQQLNYRYIHRFSRCWVPDVAGTPNLSGALGHPARLPRIPVDYLGPLSRLEISGNNTPTDRLVILLSGPEPQRSLLEAQLAQQLRHYPRPATLVRGLPGHPAPLEVPATVKVFPHLPAAALQTLLQEAAIVIARCGYSTVMDLAALQKKAVLIPTPGQTEQEYLADHLMATRRALCIPQASFQLAAALDSARKFCYRLEPLAVNTDLEAAVATFLSALPAQQ